MAGIFGMNNIDFGGDGGGDGNTMFFITQVRYMCEFAISGKCAFI
jgi:hypothetical protein